jgi:hypothetical protein
MPSVRWRGSNRPFHKRYSGIADPEVLFARLSRDVELKSYRRQAVQSLVWLAGEAPLRVLRELAHTDLRPEVMVALGRLGRMDQGDAGRVAGQLLHDGLRDEWLIRLVGESGNREAAQLVVPKLNDGDRRELLAAAFALRDLQASESAPEIYAALLRHEGDDRVASCLARVLLDLDFVPAGDPRSWSGVYREAVERRRGEQVLASELAELDDID